MTYKKMGNGGAAGNYYISSAGQNSTLRGIDDYYVQAVGSEPCGVFNDFSGALNQFGINHYDEVSVHTFQLLLAGRNPLNEQPLTETVDEKHVSGYDCTNSAPKSFSALRAIATSFGNSDLNERLLKIATKANQDSMKFLSEHAGYTRRGKGGATLEKVDLISAQWQHSTSRAADPQLHFHNTIFNIAFRKSDESSGTIESKNLMQWQTAAGAVFRASLATGLKKDFAGINIIIDEKKGAFVIDGINENLIKFWSKRKNEINNQMKASGFISLAAADRITLETRKNKTFEETPTELEIRWKEEAIKYGVNQQTVEDILTANSDQILGTSREEKEALDKQTFQVKMNSIPGMLIENESVFTEQQLYRKVAELSAGVQDLDGIKSTVNRLLTRKSEELVVKEDVLINVKDLSQRHDESNQQITTREKVLNEQREQNSVIIEMGVNKKGQKIYTTLAHIQIEADLKKRSREMSNDGTHVIDKRIIADAISKKGTISLEQADAVRWALSPGSLKIVEGGAGTGKSYSLDVTREICEASGYNLIGIALSWDAAGVLKTSANIDSVAITGFLDKLEKGTLKLTKMDVVVCDENGLVGSVYGQKILRFVQEAGSKLIVTGDSQQLNPVSAGSAMKIMLSEAGSAKITEIRRQKQQWAREMVANFAVGNSIEALTALKDLNMINILSDRQSTIDRVSSDFYSYLKNNVGKTALAICGSNDEAAQLNQSIREMKRKDGLISKFDTVIATEFGELSFAVGDKIMFRKNDNKLDIKNRKTAEILSIDGYGGGFQLRVRMHEDGRELIVDSRKFKGENGKLALHHGDAVTTYSSQGATVDQTFVMHSNITDRRLAYVAFSRHKDETHLYVDKSAVVSKIQSQLSADEYVKFQPNDQDIFDSITAQYHQQSQKVTTFDYLTEEKIEKVFAQHVVKQSSKVEYNTSAVDSMAQKWNDLLEYGDGDVSVVKTKILKNKFIPKPSGSARIIHHKEEIVTEIEDQESKTRNSAKL